MNLLWIFIGGGAGSVVRYLLSVFFPATGSFPLATFLANMFASILLGVFMIVPVSSSWKLILITGFCGGLSTFSTFSQETVSLARNGDWPMVIINILLNIVVCCAAIYLLSKYS